MLFIIVIIVMSFIIDIQAALAIRGFGIRGFDYSQT